MPLVSVIIPVYKTELYLPRCLDSLLNQTLQDLEIILVDDGSPDNSGTICDEYAKAHCNIRVIHKENSGPQAARISGMQIATGKYLAFVDSDDWVMPEMFEPMVEQAETHSADIVAVGFVRDFGNRQEYYRNTIPSGVYRDEQLKWLWDHAIFDTNTMTQAIAPSVCCKLFLRQTMVDILLNCDDKISFGEDSLHTFAALFSSRCVVVMNEHQQYRYQIREGSTTNSFYRNYLSDLYVVYDRLTVLAQPIISETLTSAIAYNYIFLYLGGISQELDRHNPTPLVDKYRRLKLIAQDQRLGKCLQKVDLNRYCKSTVIGLKLLASGKHKQYLAFYFVNKLREKTKRLLKKVFR